MLIFCIMMGDVARRKEVGVLYYGDLGVIVLGENTSIMGIKDQLVIKLKLKLFKMA